MTEKAQPKNVGEVFRMMLAVDPAAGRLWARSRRDPWLADYLAGRLHGALFQLGYERLDVETLRDFVSDLVAADG